MVTPLENYPERVWSCSSAEMGRISYLLERLEHSLVTFWSFWMQNRATPLLHPRRSARCPRTGWWRWKYDVRCGCLWCILPLHSGSFVKKVYYWFINCFLKAFLGCKHPLFCRKWLTSSKTYAESYAENKFRNGFQENRKIQGMKSEKKRRFMETSI